MSAGKRVAQAPLTTTSDEDSGSDTNQDQEEICEEKRSQTRSRLSDRAIAIIQGCKFGIDENMNKHVETDLKPEVDDAEVPNDVIDHEEVVGEADVTSSTDTVSTPSSSPLADHDYENPQSPSSTASGPVYVRQPGFSQHAHEVVTQRPRIKKMKSLANRDALAMRRREPTPPKNKPRRDPVPMRLRALPQSFWQQPNSPPHVSPASNYPVLPPLKGNEDILDVRPITPPDDESRDRERRPSRQLVPEKPSTKITVGNTDLLFRLFDGVEVKEKDGGKSHGKQKKHRKMAASNNKSMFSGHDPHMVEGLADKLFPTLSLESSRALGGATNLQLLTVRDGEKLVTLPALGVEQNYSQMLSELVMHI